MILGLVVVGAMFVAASCCCGLAVGVARRGTTPGDRLFIVVAIGGAVWAGTYGVALLTFAPALRTALEVPLWFGKLLIPVAWFLAALSYTGRDSYISPWLAATVSAPPVATLGLIVTNTNHTLIWHSYEVVEVAGLATARYEPGLWLLVQTGLSYLLIVVGVLLVVELLVTSELYDRQAIVLATAAILPTVLNIKWVLGLGPAPTLDLSPLVFPVTTGAIGYALVNYDLFSLSPATKRAGQRTAIDDFGDSVFVIDTDHRIVDLNETARETLGVEKSAVVSRQIDTVLERARFDPTDTETVVVETVAGNREFDVTSSALTDRRDRTIGWTLLLHDVTRAKRRQQRLSVLDRVMRHNIRNSMSVVMGCAEELTEQGDGERAELAQTIEQESAQLVDLSETARTVERVVGREQERAHVGVATVLQGVRERLLDTSIPLTVAIETPEGLMIETDAVVLEEVVYHAVRYLCVDLAGTTSVDIVAAEGDDRVEIAILGDVTVPEHERRAIENGQESPLEHTGYLDLWLVNWGAERLGGSLAFEAETDGGQRGAMVLTVPDLGALSATGGPVEPA